MSNTPNIRFKRFADDWEQRKLGEIAIYKNGKGHEDKQSSEGKYELINLNSISIDGGLKPSGRFVDEADDTLLENDLVMVLSDVGHGDLLGRVAIIPENNRFVLNQRVALLRPTDEINSTFLFSCINANQSYFKKQGAGSSQLNISKDSVESFIAYIPSLKEQKKIGSYLANLDNFIILHQRKCDEVRKLKKFMLQKMFPKSGELIPEIRFAGFTDAWEQRKLSEVLISLQNNTLSRAELSTEKGVAKNVHYGDILVKFREVLDVSDEQLPMIQDDTIVAKYKTSFLQNGDVIIADTAEDETVGKCTEIAGLDDETVISGLHTIPYRPLFEFASGYLGYYMNSTAYHSQLLPLMQGIKVTSISKSAMQNTDIVYPKSVDEQKQIGDYFRNLDHLITLYQRKCDELKEVKRFMLQNMFPQKG